jgi:hypothetical protein
VVGEMKYHKTVIELEILSNFPYDPADLDTVLDDIDQDVVFCQWKVKSIPLTKEEMEQALIKQELPIDTFS